MAYAGRLAIIAGGLGGLGSSIGLRLQKEGARLALLYAPFEASRRDAVLEKVYGSSNPTGVTAVECDIASDPSVREAFPRIEKYAKGNDIFPSILINAAGYVSVSPLAETTAEEATKNIVPNLLGPMFVSQAFHRLYTSYPSTQEKPPGRIVSISSQAAHVALDGHGPYCASKAGLNALTRCMALEWSPLGITCNTVSPTVVLTELGKKAWADPVKRKAMESQIPTGRFAVPEEIAGAVEFLCRDESGMISGEDLRVDGGYTQR
ncbi:short chain dehydrogenase [Emericellopsis atlantica]|uniref:Short chain dehydrogenase n=1 Tax=Emericellopsis atlantica TaxID=2614577 RepID=A0A9P7ZVF0_9HYPO|nr:short chain dehydrogenase [Emericellopsis atlantica]KAG9259043.1 short chain dehydrogenase [Emericellopsis atlantica]